MMGAGTGLNPSGRISPRSPGRPEQTNRLSVALEMQGALPRVFFLSGIQVYAMVIGSATVPCC